MASAQQAPNVAHTNSAPSHTSTPLANTTSTQRPSTVSPPNARTYAGTKANQATLAKQFLTPRVEFTGAAAQAENIRHRKEQERRAAAPPTSSAALTSLNPGRWNPFMSPAVTQTTTRSTQASPLQSSSITSQPRQAAQDPSPVKYLSHHNTRRGSQALAQAQQNALERAPATLQTQSPKPIQDEHNAGRGANMFASPEPEDKAPEASQAASGVMRSRKRALSPTSTPQPGSYTYPPINPGSGSGPSTSGVRNASLPGSGLNKSPNTKKHKCPHCSTEFTRHHNLKSHLLTHSQEKPFDCPKCDARFRRLHDLKRHSKLHTGERPHQCEKCGRSFARGDALARHMKGAGGCAGRRESGVGGEDDDLDLDGEGDAEGEDGDEEEAPRRKSEPAAKRARKDSTRLSGPQNPPQQHGSTYPPVAPMSGQSQAYYSQLPSQGQRAGGNRAGAMSPPQQQSHRGSMAGFTNPQYNHPSMVPMTESPRPLSPGQPDPYHRPSDAGTGRSPSISTRMQQQNMLRSSIGNGRATPPINHLPQPHQHLPSMQVDPRLPQQQHQGQRLPPPTISTQAPAGGHSGPSSAGPASASSHHQSSGGSTRELYGHSMTSTGGGGGSFSSAQQNVSPEYVRDLEGSLRIKDHEVSELKKQLAEIHNVRSRDNEQIAHLSQENSLLRHQLQQLAGQAQGVQGYRR